MAKQCVVYAFVFIFSLLSEKILLIEVFLKPFINYRILNTSKVSVWKERFLESK